MLLTNQKKKTLNKLFLTNIGFTFIEVILTISLFSVVMLVIVSAFYVGGRAWRKGVSQTTKNYKIYFGLDKISKLLKEGFFFKETDIYAENLKFQGAADSISFAALANLGEENKGAFDKILIYKDEADIILERIDFKNTIDKKEGIKTKILSGIKSLKFKYGRLNSDSGGFEWLDTWEDAQNTPVAYSVIVEYQKEGEEPLVVSENVFMPQIQ